MNKNEVQIGANYLKFDQSGNLQDEASKKLVADQLVAFEKWIQNVKRGFAPLLDSSSCLYLLLFDLKSLWTLLILLNFKVLIIHTQ